MIKDKNYCYKGIYYYLKDDVWYLFDDYYCGNLMLFNKQYRLDECIEQFQKNLLPYKWSIKLGIDKPWVNYEDYLKLETIKQNTNNL